MHRRCTAYPVARLRSKPGRPPAAHPLGRHGFFSYFFGSYQELNLDHDPKVEELEIEFRAQIERALLSDAFRAALARNTVRLTTYRELARTQR